MEYFDLFIYISSLVDQILTLILKDNAKCHMKERMHTQNVFIDSLQI